MTSTWSPIAEIGGDAQLGEQSLPRLVAGPGPGAHRQQRRAGPAGEVGQVETEVGEEDLPALGHTVVLVVPVGTGPEAGVDQTHDARAAVAGLDQELEGQPRAVAREDDAIGAAPTPAPDR